MNKSTSRNTPVSAGGRPGRRAHAAPDDAAARRSVAPPTAGSTECRLAFTALSGGVEPVGEFLLVPFGDVAVERPAAGGDFTFTRRHGESAVSWFERIGRKLAIDYEHQSFDRLNTRPDGLRPAAGWIGGLEVRDDGLWAVDVTWTRRAAELLRSGEYRYFSPVIYWVDEDFSDVAALGPVALTNDPAMRGVRPLAARRSAEDGGEETQARAGVLDAAELVPRRDLEAAEEQIATLRGRLAAQEADTFVERGMRLGKIVDGTSVDWREDYLRDPERAEVRLSRAPVLLPPGRVVKLDARGNPAPVGMGAGGATSAALLRRWGIEPEDLAAYEQALAEGRIKG